MARGDCPMNHRCRPWLLPMLVATCLLVASGGVAVGQQGPPAPPPVIETRLEAPGLDGPRDVVQRVLQLPAGSVVTPHTHPGPNFRTLIEGDVTLNLPVTDQPQHAGDSYNDQHTVAPFRLLYTNVAP